MKALTPIHGITIDDTGINIQVKSNGCTSREHFEPEKADLNNKTPRIAIYRIQDDTCEGMPFIETIHFNLEDFSLTGEVFGVTLNNPLTNILKKT